MTSASRALLIACAAALLAGPLHAGEPKTYRWVGEDGRVYTSTTPPPDGRGAIESPAPTAPAAALAEPPVQAPAAPAGDADSCARWSEWVDTWRQAKRSVDSAEHSLDALQSDTSGYVTRDDSYRDTRVDAATQRLEAAQVRLSRIESDTMRAGVPQRCLTD